MSKPDKRKKKPFKSSKPARRPAPPRIKKAAPAEVEGMRLNKYVAHCGVCSRRQAADFVKNGQITVNDKVVTEPFYQVREGDIVRFKGNIIRPETRLVYLLMNKPRDMITTVKDEKGRRTVMDVLSGKVEERVFPVGRLDRNTTGLLLLTNDGELAKRLTHPSHRVKKIYHVVLDKAVSQSDLDKIKAGLKLEDGHAEVDSIDYVQGREKNEVGIEIHIGKNRIVRRIFEHLGYEVRRLDRVYFAGLTKKDLPRGRFRHLSQQEVIMLRHFV